MSPLKLKKIPTLSNKNKTSGLSEKATLHPAPFIDRLSVVISVPDSEATETHKDVFPFLNHPEFFVKTNEGATGAFRVARRVPLKSLVDHQKWPTIQYAHLNGQALRMRIDFVPVDLGALGIGELHNALITILPQGWGTFIKRGKITRLDVAVDYLDKEMSDFLFLPQQAATVTTWKSDGTLETFQSGKPKGDYTQIYNRKAKRIAHKKPWKGKEGIRIERRLTHPTIERLSDLPALSNPFLKFKLVQAIDVPPTAVAKGWIWKLWLNAVDRLGLPTALAILPEDERSVYRAHYAKGMVSWWSPEEVWENWVPMLNQLGIGDLKKYN